MSIRPMRGLVFVVVGVLIAVLAAAGSAHADPPAPCRGSTCVGWDPTPCSSPNVLESVTPPGSGPSVSLKWNDWCVANWARFDDDNLPGYSPGYWVYWVETWDGHREYQIGGNHMWTAMVDGTQLARVCIESSSRNQYNCTGWH